MSAFTLNSMIQIPAHIFGKTVDPGGYDKGSIEYLEQPNRVLGHNILKTIISSTTALYSQKNTLTKIREQSMPP